MFYLIDKPIGYTSFDIIRQLRKITGIKKMGHTGTLDPLATGCLLIATDNSTKLISRLEHHEKTYIFTVDVSLSSPSLDLASETVTADMSQLQDHTNTEVITFLENQTRQVPPKFSAIHIGGKRAYDLARSGKDFDIPERAIEIRDVKILEKDLPKITIELTISSGGYIRSLAPVIADFFGVAGGGCITHLHRKSIGHLPIERAQSMEAFAPNKTIPYNEVLEHITGYHLDIIYQKTLIDGLIVDVGTEEERLSGKEILIYCGDICSLGRWTQGGIEAIRNYV